MSMLAASSMRQIVQENGCCNPSEILQRLNKVIKTTLRQDTEESESDDGLDAAICYINRTGNHLTFAGAKLALYYVYNQEVTIIRGDRQSIGYKRSELSYQFTHHDIEIQAGMKFYLSTDGFIDQTGGSKGISLGRRRFSNLLVEQSRHPYSQQQQHLWQAFNTYRGNHVRVDDVTVIGFGVSGDLPV
jgi:serine phosphatase RsbU (regulator of sigma subunit)